MTEVPVVLEVTSAPMPADESLDADQQALDAACAVLDQAAAEDPLDAEPAPEPTITLTPLQRTVLLAFPGGASAEGDNGASWTEVADLATETGLTKRQVMGVLSSLSTKGLIYADEEKANGETGTLQCLIDDGARLVGMLTAEPTEGGAATDVPAPAPVPAGTIRVTYSSVDGVRKVHTFKTLKGARQFAQERVGAHPDLGTDYAVSGDGIGKVTVEGATLADLFPRPGGGACRADDLGRVQDRRAGRGLC